jgi:hypothetical protein
LCTNYAPFGVGVLQLHQRYLIILHSRLWDSLFNSYHKLHKMKYDWCSWLAENIIMNKCLMWFLATINSSSHKNGSSSMTTGDLLGHILIICDIQNSTKQSRTEPKISHTSPTSKGDKTNNIITITSSSLKLQNNKRHPISICHAIKCCNGSHPSAQI